MQFHTIFFVIKRHYKDRFSSGLQKKAVGSERIESVVIRKLPSMSKEDECCKCTGYNFLFILSLFCPNRCIS